jgi:FkbM family methyltransferase
VVTSPSRSSRVVRWFDRLDQFPGKWRVENLLERVAAFPAGLTTVRFAEGFEMDIDLALPYERTLFLRNGELETYRYITEHLRPGVTVCDVGSNLGIYTLLAARAIGPSGAVWAFEPTPGVYARLVGHVARNGFDNVRLLPVALGAEPGASTVWHIHPDYHGMNSLAPGEEEGWTPAGETKVMTLDEVMRSEGPPSPDLVKVDVEGSELAVLQGGAALLASDHCPTVLVELSRWTTRRFGYEPEEVVRYLRSLRPFRIRWLHGRRWADVDPQRPLPHYAVQGSDDASNYVFEPVP